MAQRKSFFAWRRRAKQFRPHVAKTPSSTSEKPKETTRALHPFAHAPHQRIVAIEDRHVPCGLSREDPFLGGSSSRQKSHNGPNGLQYIKQHGDAAGETLRSIPIENC